MASQTFDTVLVANRGEIAVRVIRTLRAMGIRSVAVYSDADADARHVAEADVAVGIGPAPRATAISTSTRSSTRRPAPARRPSTPATDSSRRTLISPPLWRLRASCSSGRRSAAIQTMGDKIAAKAAVSAFGVPVVPGIARPGLTDDELIAAADEIGYPVLVKPSAGGGGKGMRVVHRARTYRPPWPARAARPRPHSATTRCFWSGLCCAPGTSRCRCWPTGTATWCTSASASAACSVGIRR